MVFRQSPALPPLRLMLLAQRLGPPSPQGGTHSLDGNDILNLSLGHFAHEEKPVKVRKRGPTRPEVDMSAENQPALECQRYQKVLSLDECIQYPIVSK